MGSWYLGELTLCSWVRLIRTWLQNKSSFIPFDVRAVFCQSPVSVFSLLFPVPSPTPSSSLLWTSHCSNSEGPQQHHPLLHGGGLVRGEEEEEEEEHCGWGMGTHVNLDTAANCNLCTSEARWEAVKRSPEVRAS